MQKKKQLPNGFSLLEIIIVIAILAIVSTIATVGFVRWQSHSKIHFAKDRLLDTLHTYRLLAIDENVSYRCQVAGATLICRCFTFNKKGELGWHDRKKKRIIDSSLQMKITESTPEESHAIYFLSSGEVPPFALEIREGKNRLYQLKSHDYRIIEGN
jgi:prepilin-type N-terminal cleavage/methylation domain-containing protein